MANYKESSISGNQWQRCWGVFIQNVYNKTPHISMKEEQITLVGDQTFTKDVGQIDFAFDPQANIALLDVVTGEPTGSTMSMMQVYQALWSLYMEKAVARDVAQAALLAAEAAAAAAQVPEPPPAPIP